MTRPKLPLPSLRFVILTRSGAVLYQLIPETTPKGRVVADRWCLPGGKIKTTDELKAMCRRNGCRHKIEGSPR